MICIQGGIFKGRKLHVPPEARPTSAKIRQAIFNSLRVRIPDALILDCFAGSGALGFEALSWGARHVVFVDQSRSAIECIIKNTQALKLSTQVNYVAANVLNCHNQIKSFIPFDIIFADPPYFQEVVQTFMLQQIWKQWVSPSGILCAEFDKRIWQSLSENIKSGIQKQKAYGDTVIIYCT